MSCRDSPKLDRLGSVVDPCARDLLSACSASGYGPVEDIAGMNRALTVFVLVLTLIVAGNFREVMPAIVILIRSR